MTYSYPFLIIMLRSLPLPTNIRLVQLKPEKWRKFWNQKWLQAQKFLFGVTSQRQCICGVLYMIRSELWSSAAFQKGMPHVASGWTIMVLWNCKYRKCKQKSYFHKRVEYKPKLLPISMQQWSNTIEWRMLFGKQFKPFLINWSMWTKRKLHFRYIRDNKTVQI